MIIVPFLILVALIVVVVILARRATGRQNTPVRGQSVRRFFQYALMLGMLFVFASGISGLLARLFGTDIIYSSEEDLARNLAFVVVGGPAYLFLALWARRLLAQDRTEKSSVSWAFYTSAAALISLVTLIGPFHELLLWAFGLRSWNGSQLASVLVWAAVWATHWVVARATVPQARALPHVLLGSVIGLVITVVGLASTLGASFNAVFDLGGIAFIGSGNNGILRGVAWALVGIPVWIIYWLSTAAKVERDPLWFAYVFLAGVAGGLVTAISATSVVVYDTLVWLIGEPRVDDFAGHFDALGISIGTAVVGLLVWWYHQTLIEQSTQRTEVRRIYEYVMSAGGLGAAAVGVAMLIVAFIQSVTPGDLIVGGSAINSLLLAVTFLLVGTPVWLRYWIGAQHADPATEQASPTRRFYLFILFGVGGIAAIIGLLVAAYLLFTDAIEGDLAASTLRDMRFALSVVLTTGAVAGYHWTVYRGERHISIREERLNSILLIGQGNRDEAHALERMINARVKVMTPTDVASTWSAQAVASALADVESRDVVVLVEPSGIRVIPVE